MKGDDGVTNRGVHAPAEGTDGPDLANGMQMPAGGNLISPDRAGTHEGDSVQGASSGAASRREAPLALVHAAGTRTETIPARDNGQTGAVLAPVTPRTAPHKSDDAGRTPILEPDAQQNAPGSAHVAAERETRAPAETSAPRAAARAPTGAPAAGPSTKPEPEHHLPAMESRPAAMREQAAMRQQLAAPAPLAPDNSADAWTKAQAVQSIEGPDVSLAGTGHADRPVLRFATADAAGPGHDPSGAATDAVPQPAASASRADAPATADGARPPASPGNTAFPEPRYPPVPGTVAEEPLADGDHTHEPAAAIVPAGPTQSSAAGSGQPMPIHGIGADPSRQIAGQLAAVARALPDGPVEIVLEPEELGRVRMQLTGSDGVMSVQINVERPETAALMRRHIDLLASELRELGYADVSFEFTGDRRGSEREDGGASAAGLAPTGAIGIDGTTDQGAHAAGAEGRAFSAPRADGRRLDLRL
ncbi:flagellar hook-length control protein FliK [Meinhardsimonia xiamenensis]|nr:flagellar hook-length control protein FliK [Meinhardsimonia xiamenensis]